MAHTKIQLSQIENGRILKQLIEWYTSRERTFVRRFNTLRRRSRRGAVEAGYGPADMHRLIQEARARGAQT